MPRNSCNLGRLDGSFSRKRTEKRKGATNLADSWATIVVSRTNAAAADHAVIPTNDPAGGTFVPNSGPAKRFTLEVPAKRRDKQIMTHPLPPRTIPAIS